MSIKSLINPNPHGNANGTYVVYSTKSECDTLISGQNVILFANADTQTQLVFQGGGYTGLTTCNFNVPNMGQNTELTFPDPGTSTATVAYIGSPAANPFKYNTISTTNATATPIFTLTCTPQTCYNLNYDIACRNTSDNTDFGSITGNILLKQGTAGSSPTYTDVSHVITNNGASLSAINYTITVSANTFVLNIEGVASTNITWNCQSQLFDV
jgi:hypothetical protein